MDFTKYGNFNSDGSEFGIKRFDTPKLWNNYAWNKNIRVRIDQRGRGDSVFRDKNGNRTNLIKDRIVYVKDRDTGDFFTHSWSPVKLDFENYQTSHGLGYTKTSTQNNGLEVNCTFTCAMDAPVEIWRISVKNTTDKDKTLSVYPFVEFDLGGFAIYGGIENTISSKITEDKKTILAINNSDQRKEAKNNCFVSVDFDPDGIQTSKKYFLGSIYDDLGSPKALKDDSLGFFATASEETIGVFQKDINLSPGQDFTFHLVIGPFQNYSETSAYNKYLTADEFELQIKKQKQFRDKFKNIDFQIPDDYFQKFFNIWNKQQVAIHADWAGGYNMGFRCSMQSAQAICPYDGQKSKERILIAMKHQYCDGSALRSYWPLDEHRYADSGVWLTFALTDYIKETGDFDILQEAVPYYDEGEATVYEHTLNAIDWIYRNPGKHDLPRVLFGDWNDSLNIGIKGEGESVWLAMALYWAHKLMIELAERINDNETVKKLTKLNAKLSNAVNQHCWDGQWYIRGFTDEGNVVGSNSCREGKIFANTQTWAIMSGIADKDKYKILEDALQKHLMTDYGLLVCFPGYDDYNPEIGRASTMPVGWGENASAYCHVSGFKAVADCIRGDGNAAVDTLTRILGCNPDHPIDISGIEPYSLTNMFNGPQHPRAGVTLKSWFTGTGPWTLRSITHWLLGIRPEYDGLTIDPVLPKAWKNITIKREFRNAVYNISINNTCQGDQKMHIEIDGNVIDGNFIEYSKYNKQHEINICWK